MDYQKNSSLQTRCPMHKLSMFAGMDSRLLGFLQTLNSNNLIYQDAEPIYGVNSPAKHFYILHEGYVKLSKTLSSGKEQIIRVLKAGELFGFDGFVDELYNHSAVSLRKTEVCCIPVSELQKLGECKAELERLIMVRCIKELQHADERLLELGAKRSAERLASFLLAWCAGTPVGRATPLVLSRLEIAQLLGLTIETVSRLFASWKRAGIIKENRQAIQIINLPQLSAFSASQH